MPKTKKCSAEVTIQTWNQYVVTVEDVEIDEFGNYDEDEIARRALENFNEDNETSGDGGNDVEFIEIIPNEDDEDENEEDD
ncbi:hypothetical protein EOM81_01625 [bacterium]|nr:hypothetical protein [bacterium]